MHVRQIIPATPGLLVLLAACVLGCADMDPFVLGGQGPELSGSGGGGGGADGAGGAESTSGQGGQDPTGGQGAATAEAEHGPAATDIVSAGQVSESPSFRLVFTFGQSTQNQQSTSSPSYRLEGGLIGANGSLP